MHYTFGEFEFDCDNLVLSQNGQTVDIRNNEAKLLAVLIQHSDKVLSKEDILSLVWQGKVVSEQAVFQNISHLRNILGSDAIKTFPKRGYQWQLNTETVTPGTQANTTLRPEPRATDLPSTAQPKINSLHWIYVSAIVAISMVLLASFWFSASSKLESNTHFKIAYTPIDAPNADTQIRVDDTEQITFTLLTQVNSKKFSDSIALEYPLIANEHPFVLTANFKQHNEAVYLDFLLKGPFDKWSGQLSGPSTKNIIEQLQSHLTQKFIYELLQAPKKLEVKQAMLSLAHQNAPKDLIILGRLVKAYIALKEYDKALVMAEKLAAEALADNKIQQLGNAYFYQGKILARKNLFDLSLTKFTTAVKQFEKIDNKARQAEVWRSIALVNNESRSYLEIRTDLLKSMQLAEIDQDIHGELHALKLLSVTAYKRGIENEQYAYLQQAEDKMKAHALPPYHFAVIPFHYAMFNRTPSLQEPYLKQVLEYTKATPQHWFAQDSRLQLMLFYIEQDRLPEGQKLLTELQVDNAQNSYLNALLLKAEGKVDDAIFYAKRTFEQAQMAGLKRYSLDSALILYTTPHSSINNVFYEKHIQENATPRWRRINEDKLQTLSL